MRRASSLFDIDQAPLFEPLALDAEADGAGSHVHGLRARCHLPAAPDFIFIIR